MNHRPLLTYLFIGLGLALPMRVQAIAFTAQPSLSHTTISNETLSPNGTTVQFGLDGAATVTAYFYRVSSSGDRTFVDSASGIYTGGASKELFWDARWLIGEDLGRQNGNYEFRVVASTGSSSTDTGFLSTTLVLDSVDIHGVTLSQGVDSSGNATAPFVIQYSLAKEARVTMTLLDSSGNLVRTLVSNQLKSGESVSSHTIVWDGLAQSGAPASIGVYTLKIDATNIANGDTAITRTRSLTLASLAGISSDVKSLFAENAYVYPNPIRSGQGLFRVQTIRNNAKLSIKIYTLTGDLVRSQNFTGLNSGDITNWSWDAKNSSGNKVGRGLYYAVVREESGEGTLQTVEKVAVIE